MKISIFTPTNNSKFLKDVYESIKDQDFYEWIIVFNNGGVPLEFDDKRVKTFILWNAPEYVGAMKSFCCEKATGDILLELDHDDRLFPDAIEEVKKAFKNPYVGFVYSNTVHCDTNYNKLMRFDERYGWKYREIEYQGHSLDEHISFEPTPESISRIWFAPNHLRAFRKSVYDEVGGYNVNMRILDDLDLMCRMYQVTKFHHINKPLYLYVVHGENTWLRFNEEIQNNVYRIYDQYIDAISFAWATRNKLRCVELGGRIDAMQGYETLDLKDADIIHDLNEKWPFEDSSVGCFRSINLFEHLKDPIFVMKELYRCLAPGGWAFIKVPSTDGRGAFQDPTHVSFWNENSFYYYTDEEMAKYIDTPVRFQATRLYTTEKNEIGVCWTVCHLVNLKDDYKTCGEIKI